MEMCSTLLGAMLHLRVGDLALWVRDGEEFVHRQASQGDKEHLRPAAESLLLALHAMPTRSALVVRCVLENAQRCEAVFAADSALYAVDPSPDALDGAPDARRRAMDAMRPTLNRDAAYLALGILSFELVRDQAFAFSSWFVSTGVPLLQHSAPTIATRVLQRRVIWLLSCCCADLAPVRFELCARAFAARGVLRDDPSDASIDAPSSAPSRSWTALSLPLAFRTNPSVHTLIRSP